MDTTRDIVYRGFTLNDESISDSVTGGGAIGDGIEGCVVDTVDFADVDVVQWMEKRSQSDGMDVGEVNYGSRRIRMAGTLYSKARTTLFDQLFTMRAALNAVLAQREEPLDHGYRPLYFSVPTDRTDDYPEAVIPLQIRAMPRALQAVFNRDHTGGQADTDALAIPWQATFLCRDPGIYSQDPVEVNFTATSVVTGTTGAEATDLFTKASHGLSAGDRITFSSLTGGTGLSTGVTYWVIASGLTSSAFKLSTTSGGAAVNFTTDVSASTWVKSSTASGTWTNRGNYLGKFNALIEVGAGAGTINVTVGDSIFTVTIAASTGNRIIRIKDDKLITIEEDDIELPRLSTLVFAGDATWPLIDPGDTAYSVTFHGMAGVKAGSLMWFYEQYA